MCLLLFGTLPNVLTCIFSARAIHKKLGIKLAKVELGEGTMELFRGIQSQLTALLDGLDPKDLATMSLGLSHSLSR